MKVIEFLRKSHERNSFDCGNEALNQFFRQTARQHNQKGVSRTFVLSDTAKPEMLLPLETIKQLSS